MNRILEILKQNADSLKGRVITDDEIFFLKEKFSFLEWLSDFNEALKSFCLIGMRFDLPEKEDDSGNGVRLKWMTPKEQAEESLDYYPGLIIVKKGFLPFGTCMAGSGDPYFLRFEENELRVYRVLHDYEEYDEAMVEFVTSLEQLLIRNLG